MQRVSLSRSLVALVDDEDFAHVSQFKWWILAGRGVFYAMGHVNKQPVLMHRFILDAEKGQMIDHINRDTLDNRRLNLRFCTMSQNQANSKVRTDSQTLLRGIQRRKDSDRFRVRLQINGKRLNIGTFPTLMMAQAAHRQAYLQGFGEFARL